MLSHYLAPRLARIGLHYGWVVTAVAFLTMLATSATVGIPGVLMLPLKTEFGWDVGAISGALALRLMLYGIVAPFAAALMHRYGIRRVVICALATTVAGLTLASQMHTLWQLWLTWGVMLGLCTGITANVLGATIATRWFTKRRGLVVGILSASNATGQLLFLPIAAWLSEHWGWRAAMAPATIACCVCFVIFLLVVPNHPSDVNLPSYGEDAVTLPPDPRSRGNALLLSFQALAVAARSKVFWVLALSFLVCGFSTSGLVQNHFVPLCHDFGMDAVAASGVLALMGACDFVGTVGSGWLSDRYNNRWLLGWYYGLRGISLLLLPNLNFSFYGLSAFAIFYGLDWIATVPPTVKLTGKTFGKERAPLIFGWMYTGHQIGAAIAAYGAGLTRDDLASYIPAFTTAGIACLIASLAVILVRRPAAEVQPYVA